MVFLLIAALVLVVSFIIAFVSLVQEQNKSQRRAMLQEQPAAPQDGEIRTSEVKTAVKDDAALMPLPEKPQVLPNKEGVSAKADSEFVPFPWESNFAPLSKTGNTEENAKENVIKKNPDSSDALNLHKTRNIGSASPSGLGGSISLKDLKRND